MAALVEWAKPRTDYFVQPGTQLPPAQSIQPMAPAPQQGPSLLDTLLSYAQLPPPPTPKALPAAKKPRQTEGPILDEQGVKALGDTFKTRKY